MDFVANRNILNGPQLNLTVLSPDKQPHWAKYPEAWKRDKLYIHKGMRFSIGTAQTAEELKGNEADARKVLWVAHPNTPLPARQAVPLLEAKLVEKIDKETAAELETLAKVSKPQPSMEEAIASAVASALVAAGVIKAPAK